MRDSLTGLHDRHFVTGELDRVLERAEMIARPFSVVLLGIAEPAWDVPGRVALVLRTALRSSDVLARFAEREFLLVVSERDHACVRQLIARVTGVLKDRARVSVDVGLASWPEDGHSVEEILDAARRHLRSEHCEEADSRR